MADPLTPRLALLALAGEPRVDDLAVRLVGRYDDALCPHVSFVDPSSYLPAAVVAGALLCDDCACAYTTLLRLAVHAAPTGGG